MRGPAPTEPSDATPTEDARPQLPAPPRAATRSVPGPKRLRRRTHTVTVFTAVAVLAVAVGTVVGAAERPSAGGADPFPSNGTPLNALTPVTGAFESGDSAPSDDGKPFAYVLAQDVGCVASGFVVYALDAEESALTASLGLDDHSRDADATPEVQIYGDGRLLGSYKAAPARKAPVQVRVDLTSVSLLTISWQYPATAQQAGGGACRPVATLLIGDPALM
ncbi:MAG TPA: NPCBM/NEW2 domain-containing protein [Actinocrinis sp.]